MLRAGDAVNKQAACEIEVETLFMPSDFTSSERTVLGITVLGGEEVKLREGQAFDALQAIQSAVKCVLSLWDHKHKDSRGQTQNTRSLVLIKKAEARRDNHMETYAAARKAMISLGFLDDVSGDRSPFPPLKLEDTFMKSRQRRREVGDSRRPDGPLWRAGKITVGSRTSMSPTKSSEAKSDIEDSIGACHYHSPQLCLT